MTAKADFTEDEWKTVLDARQQRGENELLDEIVSAKPEIDRTRYRSMEEVREHGLRRVRDAVEVLERKTTAQEARRLSAIRPGACREAP